MNEMPTNPSLNIKLAVTEDHELVREGLSQILDSFEGLSVIIKAAHGKELIDKLSTGLLPDICLLDVQMPVMNGYKTLREIKTKWPEIKVIILTMLSERFVRQRTMMLGADGYLVKNCDPKTLDVAIRTIFNNGYYFFDPATKNYSIKKDTKSVPIITDKEIEFLKLCGTGLSYEEIAKIFKVSPRTVQSYQNSLAEKLHLKTRTELAVFAKDAGFI
ncbi:MAG: response regulator transcription factor [Bacteroidetes bacterium]|nr:response regulator transcription factor [Bacteroidota bacterium]